MLNILFLELQAFPATPVGDLFLVIFSFPLQIYKECKNNGTITR